MTPSQINQAIAGECGISTGCNCIDWGAMDHLSTCPAHSRQLESIPNYHGSLDAMAAAEKTLTDGEYHAFTLQLNEIAWRIHPEGRPDLIARYRCVFSATAAQRAEAFLRTRNKWID